MALKDHPVRDHLVAFIGEFVGTFLFLFFSFAGAQTANLSYENPAVKAGPDPARLLYVSLIFGFSLAVNVWIFFRVSGGLFNPAATLALCLVGAVTPFKALLAAAAQVAGGALAAVVVKFILPGDEVLFAVSLDPGVSIVQGLFIEMLLTLELVFAILMLAAEKTRATFIAPIGIGLALFVGHMVGVYWTGAGINPARALGPAIASLSFPVYHWLYWVGPLVGAVIAAALYKLLKLLDYEAVNGHQDIPADEAVALEAHAERIEKALKSWRPTGGMWSNWRNSGIPMRDAVVRAPSRPKTPPNDLRVPGASSMDGLIGMAQSSPGKSIVRDMSSMDNIKQPLEYDVGQYERQVEWSCFPSTLSVNGPLGTSKQMKAEF